MATSINEREMTRNQRGLVDTCFEEGQYESGIALLDQLRSASFIPPADHIRQLLYIALFPPPPATEDQINQQERLPPSPVKGSPSKQKHSMPKASLFPSVPASEAAHRLLFSFLSTNSPGSLIRALPRYPLDDAVGGDMPPEGNSAGHDEDSAIARESLCIKDSKNCWAILKGGFIQRKKLLNQDGKRKRGRNAYHIEDADLDPSRATEPDLVADHAWPVLDWLLSLFEKDEMLHAQKSKANFSPLLFSQIPPPRGGVGPRWEADACLDIIFHCVDQEDSQRRQMSTRLLTLLINLSQTGSFDGSMFAATLMPRLYASSSQAAQYLMESLFKTITVLTFKITVCQKFLSTAPSATGSTKPRPKPLPRRPLRRDSGANASISESHAEFSVAAPKPMLATGSEVFELLSNAPKPQKSASAPPVLTIKYALVLSYAHLQGLLPPDQRDGDWKEAITNGGLKHVIDTAFPSDSTYHAALTIVSGFWPSEAQGVGYSTQTC